MGKQGRSWEKQGRPRRPEAGEAAKQERTGEEPAGSGKGQGGREMDHGSIGQEQNRRREDSGRELATKTEPEKIREGMGDKWGRSMETTGEEPARIGKGQERT